MNINTLVPIFGKAKNMLRHVCLFLMVTILFYGSTHAQEQISSLKGKVTVLDDGNPVEFASLQVFPQGLMSTTNSKGEYVFEKLTPGRIQLKLNFLGMESVDTTFVLIAGDQVTLNLQLRKSSLRLNLVTVVGQESKSGSTSSTISRQAMDHLQTSSLSDIMQLLPGGVTANSTMAEAKTMSIRNLGGVSSQMNSMGTSIVVDGAPLSNNSNLQTLHPTIQGSTNDLKNGSSAHSGLDVRTISTDNIESVEVIRGIPSVEYGDLTSGLMIINSKAGKEPIKLRFKTDPSIYQASIGGGTNLGKNAGALNISADYLYSLSDVTVAYAYYQRASAKAMYSNVFGRVSSNTSLDFSLGKDTREKNPNDLRAQLMTGSRDLGLRFNTNGNWNVRQGWLTNVKYVLSASTHDKHTFREEQLGNAFAPYSMSLTDGAVLSNRPGQKVYDIDGKELTHIPSSESGYTATFLPNDYFSRYDIYGEEINVFAKLTANFFKKFGSVTNRILLGADFKTDGNLGDGKVYDLNNPPYRINTSENSSSRPRKYSDIPFFNQFSVYGEENLIWSVGERELNLQAGMRFDSFNGKNALTPRTNLSFDVIPGKFWLRGGYGKHAKSPSTLYLYPELAYFDFVHFNTLNSSFVPENEQLFLASTRSFQTENKDLKLAMNSKSELGFDLRINKMRFSVTGYNERLDGGYNLGRTADNFKLIDFTQYEVGEQVTGSIPTLKEKSTNKIFVNYSSPMNNVKSHNRGIEFDFDFGRFDAIRTSFVLNGAYMRNTGWLDEHRFSTRKNLNSLEHNIGIYDKDYEKDEGERFVSTLRAIHHIPYIGFVLTATAQVNWVDNTWKTYGNDTMFVAYISREDGQVRPFDPAKKNDPEFAYMFDNKSDKRFIREFYQPVLLINFHLTKEIGKDMRASFYANNMFNNRPLYESRQDPGKFRRLNIPMYFGFEFSVNIN